MTDKLTRAPFILRLAFLLGYTVRFVFDSYKANEWHRARKKHYLDRGILLE